jgi:hypothetical protein
LKPTNFKAYFPEVHGETLKVMPKGYPADHPEIELLRRKELFFVHRYTDKEVLKPNFADEVVRGCRIIKPYCDFLNYLFSMKRRNPLCFKPTIYDHEKSFSMCCLAFYWHRSPRHKQQQNSRLATSIKLRQGLWEGRYTFAISAHSTPMANWLGWVI